MENMRKAKSKKANDGSEIELEIAPAQKEGGRARGRPRRTAEGEVSLESASLADAQQALGSIKSRAGLDLTEKVKDLLRLAKEQGHLTYDDINDALPDHMVTAADLDQVHSKLREI